MKDMRVCYATCYLSELICRDTCLEIWWQVSNIVWRMEERHMTEDMLCNMLVV